MMTDQIFLESRWSHCNVFAHPQTGDWSDLRRISCTHNVSLAALTIELSCTLFVARHSRHNNN